VRKYERASRRAGAVRLLRDIPSGCAIATLIGVTPRAVAYWRRGERAPTIRHSRQLRALYSIVSTARRGGE
jgi:hypothetical protein